MLKGPILAFAKVSNMGVRRQGREQHMTKSRMTFGMVWKKEINMVKKTPTNTPPFKWSIVTKELKRTLKKTSINVTKRAPGMVFVTKRSVLGRIPKLTT